MGLRIGRSRTELVEGQLPFTPLRATCLTTTYLFGRHGGHIPYSEANETMLCSIRAR
jgi:hypothetical protein